MQVQSSLQAFYPLLLGLVTAFCGGHLGHGIRPPPPYKAAPPGYIGVGIIECRSQRREQHAVRAAQQGVRVIRVRRVLERLDQHLHHRLSDPVDGRRHERKYQDTEDVHAQHVLPVIRELARVRVHHELWIQLQRHVQGLQQHQVADDHMTHRVPHVGHVPHEQVHVPRSDTPQAAKERVVDGQLAYLIRADHPLDNHLDPRDEHVSRLVWDVRQQPDLLGG
mmetsp:Transcript_5685/g.15295  ORF Transcript_5685/g.15295 Transcript_5685/m.15295 type:complete len:222 (+) Transcript_5685:106-771(+)